METMTFGHLRIDFDDRVLRPRPWTASQSAWAAELLRDLPDGPVLELCAGAGQIGLLALADERRDLVLVDLDETACEFARVNARRAGLAGDVVVRQAPLHEALGADERFVFVIADPPWVPSDAVGRFPEDPVTAIDGGPDGLAVAWACIDVIARHLADGGVAVIQLGTKNQADAVRERLAAEPGLRLEVAETRSYGDRGVLVLLRQPATTPSG